MSRPQIPGFYYDEEKNKWFKVQEDRHAVPGSRYSASEVKRRLAKDQEHQQQRKRLKVIKSLVRGYSGPVNVVANGVYTREFGVSSNTIIPRSIQAEAFAMGLRNKGTVHLLPPTTSSQSSVNISSMYIGNEDTKTGLGVAYGSLDETTLIGSYIARDSSDRVDDATFHKQYAGPIRAEEMRFEQISSLSYHDGKLLVTSREPRASVGVSCLQLQVAEPDDPRPHWLIGESDLTVNIAIRNPVLHVVNTCKPAPISSETLCVLGTGRGVARARKHGRVDWLSPLPSAWPEERPRWGTDAIFGVDFLPHNPDVVLAGGRPNSLWVLDLRAPRDEWDLIRHASTVAHVRAVNEHQVLAAGPQSAMALYDLRYRRSRPNGSEPLLAFPDYRNAAHLHIGLDAEPARGVVAAAHDDGTVALFSLRDGRRLLSGAASAGGGIGGVAVQGVVKCLQFQTLPGDRNPSLFVGAGPVIEKFSFGLRDGYDEWGSGV